MAWRLAKSLETLREQVNTLSPKRSKASDGTIGDAAHASRSSDHNPHVKDGAMGVVTALDITDDKAHGVNSRQLAEALVASRDPRIKYVISDGQIANSAATGGKPAWAWRPYSGKNPHSMHMHVSVKATKKLYDDTAAWSLPGFSVTAAQAAKAPRKDDPMLEKGAKGEAVKTLQTLLGFAKDGVDGVFGKDTEAAVRAFQKAKGLGVDGKVGQYTWAALRAKPATAVAAKVPVLDAVPAAPAKAGMVGGLLGGLVVDIVGGKIKDALAREVRNDNSPITRDKAPEIAGRIIEQVVPVVVEQLAPKVEKQVEQVATNAGNNEPWWQSRIILSGAVGVITLVLGFGGIAVDEALRTEITDGIQQTIIVVTGVIALGSQLYSLYGRVFGKKLKPLFSGE